MRMKLRQFLSLVSDKTISSYTIIAFQAADYPFLFFSLIQEQIKTYASLDPIDLQEQDLSWYMSRLQTTFLGQSMIYWLKNVDSLDDKKKSQLYDFLKNYTGPHTLIFCSQDAASLTFKAKAATIELDAVDKDLFAQLLQFSGVSPSKRIDLLMSRLFGRSIRLSIDQVCLLSRYLRMAGTATDQLIDQWLDNIIQPEHSLFTLSQYFFAKNADSFLKEWHRISSDYADVFWITYWGEQVWRAAQVVSAHEQKQSSQAKAIGFRLPFSFLQNDWKKYTYRELTQAHDCIYSLDYQLKNGSDMAVFDLFFASFFSGKFK